MTALQAALGAKVSTQDRKNERAAALARVAARDG
jgi:hypothetical protein